MFGNPLEQCISTGQAGSDTLLLGVGLTYSYLAQHPGQSISTHSQLVSHKIIVNSIQVETRVDTSQEPIASDNLFILLTGNCIN